ncbi:hypothetical protein GUITHDRAFT_102803 [Guillardia theta CCMP2712]|uniref:Uncharacterized protein n=2 Tax=Guillardia theta TaxID=55529 RepID=L1JTL3_GUITC|nr:hypothetical protein GUITHDRAFT_102803 [Guillardia theta CCMP2712]EKX51540.1 hypothetical protein GUITHDRAFT_102803 [Guillardia theta CCMP2712]|mmetsp:Transcript_12843/g.45080  ORF Transcript_12843/g.45080 Transcript_12843/m.45080 type:complete len:245 (+) Transcript_12843:178-912(+)|eukprot:XP_005838520.1 hypothetical protein GUITHDRAFT_102803 [Guillardia theta CCMP2712]
MPEDALHLMISGLRAVGRPQAKFPGQETWHPTAMVRSSSMQNQRKVLRLTDSLSERAQSSDSKVLPATAQQEQGSGRKNVGFKVAKLKEVLEYGRSQDHNQNFGQGRRTAGDVDAKGFSIDCMPISKAPSTDVIRDRTRRQSTIVFSSSSSSSDQGAQRKGIQVDVELERQKALQRIALRKVQEQERQQAEKEQLDKRRSEKIEMKRMMDEDVQRRRAQVYALNYLMQQQEWASWQQFSEEHLQ